MIEYLVNNNKYSFSYKELKEKYQEYCSLDNIKFKEKVLEIAHLACFISFLKELSIHQTIGDEGVVHELLHLANNIYVEEYDIQRVKDIFINVCKLT